MNRIWIGVLALVVVLLGLIGYGLWSGLIRFDATGYLCRVDDEIDTADRAAVEKTAIEYAQAALSLNTDRAYAMMTSEGQRTTTPQNFSAGMQGLVRNAGAFGAIEREHTYFLNTAGTGSDSRAQCATPDGKQVVLEVRGGLKQAHVILLSTTRNNRWEIDVWLLQQGGAWRVRYFHVGIVSMAGHSPEEMLRLARSERAAGHAFNATMLYIGAKALVDRGTAYRVALADDVFKDMQEFKASREFDGRPPFTWTMNGTAYRVGFVTILGIDGKLGLIFDLPLAAWSGEADAGRTNHAFLDAFMATHKDYSRVFGFLLARAQKPDGSGSYGTVYEEGKGYEPPKN